jgi:hypothetical protein
MCRTSGRKAKRLLWFINFRLSELSLELIQGGRKIGCPLMLHGEARERFHFYWLCRHKWLQYWEHRKSHYLTACYLVSFVWGMFINTMFQYLALLPSSGNKLRLHWNLFVIPLIWEIIIVTCRGLCVTYRTGFWIGWLDSLYIHNLGLQALQRCRYSTQFPVHHWTHTGVLNFY